MRKTIVGLRYTLYDEQNRLKVLVDNPTTNDLEEVRTIRSKDENSYATNNRYKLESFLQNLRRKEKSLLFGVRCV